MPTDYGIRPYAHSDVDEEGNERNFVDIVSAPSWAYALSKTVQKHSEMMKPYLTDEDYPGMEQNYPWYPGQPTLNPPVFPPPGNFNPALGCMCGCSAPLYCDDPVRCYPQIFSSPPQMTPSQGEDALSWRVYVNGRRYSDWKYYTSSIVQTKNPETGAIINTTKPGVNVFPLEINPPDGSWAEWPGEEMDKVYVEMTDATGNICGTTLDVFCRSKDCCVDPPAFSIDDDSTPDTIAKNTTISLFVLGGCPDFTWLITSGTGYTLGAATTSARTNTLTCVDGTCVTNFSSTVTVSVTDKCGASDTVSLRNTSGQWEQTSRYIVGDGPPCFPAGAGGYHCREIAYSDIKRGVVESINLFGGWSACADTGTTCPWALWSGAADSFPPGCGSGTGCADFSDPECTGSKQANTYRNLSIQKWQCGGSVALGC